MDAYFSADAETDGPIALTQPAMPGTVFDATTDGTLSLAIPTALPDTDVEVLVVIDVAQRLAP